MEDKREFDYIHLRITRAEERYAAQQVVDEAWKVRMEEKVDKLISFRGWVLGVTTTVSGAMTLIVTYLTGGFHRG